MNSQQLRKRDDFEGILILNTDASIDPILTSATLSQTTAPTITYQWLVNWPQVFKNRSILAPQDEVYLCEHEFSGDIFTGIAGTTSNPITADVLFNTSQLCNFNVSLSFADSGYVANSPTSVQTPASLPIVNCISMATSGSLSWLSVGQNIYGGFRSAPKSTFISRTPQTQSIVTITLVASQSTYVPNPEYNPFEWQSICSGTHTIRFKLLH